MKFKFCFLPPVFSVFTSLIAVAVEQPTTAATEGTPTLVGNVETVPMTISTSLLTHSQLFIRVRAE